METLNPTYEQFKKLTAEGKTVVDFWATWCGPCRSQAPILEKLEKEGEVNLIKIDVDTGSALEDVFEISSIPTLVLYDNGKVVKKFVGLTPLDEIKAAFGL